MGNRTTRCSKMKQIKCISEVAGISVVSLFVHFFFTTSDTCGFLHISFVKLSKSFFTVHLNVKDLNRQCTVHVQTKAISMPVFKDRHLTVKCKQ